MFYLFLRRGSFFQNLCTILHEEDDDACIFSSTVSNVLPLLTFEEISLLMFA